MAQGSSEPYSLGLGGAGDGDDSVFLVRARLRGIEDVLLMGSQLPQGGGSNST